MIWKTLFIGGQSTFLFPEHCQQRSEHVWNQIQPCSISPLLRDSRRETTGEPFSSKGQVRSETLSCATFHAVGRAGKKWHIHDLCRCLVPDWSVQRVLDVYCTTWAGNRKEEGLSPWRFPRCRNKKSPHSLTCIQVPRGL